MDEDFNGNITVDDLSWTNYSMNSPYYGNVTITSTSSSFISTVLANGPSGAFLTSSGANGSSWASSYSHPSIKVTGDAEFDGDVKIQGHSVVKLLKTIEDRLAIIQDPSPEKLEKFAALKKAYEHYKTLERLIGED